MRKIPKFLFLLAAALVLTIPVVGQSAGRGRQTASTFNLTVNANVKAFQVFINGDEQKGNVFELPGGTYNLTVKAPGHMDFNTTVQLNGDQKVNAVLQPMTGTLNVEAPSGTGLMVFVDDGLINLPKGGKTSSLVLPVGTHTVRYELGFVVAETKVTINIGQTVTVTPLFTIQVR
jgi:hypothetical protein